MRQSFPKVQIAKLCGLFGVTRQAFYEASWYEDNEIYQQQIIIELVRLHRQDMQKIGGLKLFFLIKPELTSMNIDIGRDKFMQILRENSLVIRKKRRKIYTTMSRHRFRKYPNIIRDLAVTRPDQLWVSDITYIELKERFCYLALVTDAYSRRIVGFNISLKLDANNCLAALQMALNSRINENNSLIHHSDRGIQYCCNEYIKLLEMNKINISMTENGDPYENALAERVNGILKHEFLLIEVFESYEDAFAATVKGIATYNSKRPHASINYLTPDQAHKKSGFLEKKWKSSRQIIIEEILADDGF